MSFRVSDLVAQGIIQGNSAYATIFYDSQDTGYYVDPNSVSNLYNAYIGRVLINWDGTDTWFRMQSGNRMRITTTGGTDFIIPNTGNMTYNGNTVWHAGNDGSGSGLDADLLDGLNSSSFYIKSGDTLTGAMVLNDSAYFRGSSTYGFRFNNNADTLNNMTLTNANGDLYVRGQIYVGGNGSSTGTQVVYNSGTWGISISGNAATATNSSQLQGLSIDQIFNNRGSNHGTYSNFDSVSIFGPYFIQGSTNGPGTGSSQFYGISLGLGNDYPYSQYVMQMAIPRYNSSDKYLTYRTREAGTWGSWVKVSAGYADSAGNADTVDNFHASQSTVANNIVVRDGNGYIFGNYINMTDDGNPGGGTSISSFITKQGDNYYRSVSPTNAMASIRGVASGTWGINITGTAGSVDFNNLTNKTGGTGTYQTSGDFRAPIFYDSQNTAYYGDFASFSYLNQLGIADWQYIGGQTSNGQSNYQWDGATYRNPGDWTARLILRRDNASTGINGAIPSLVLFNNNGGDQTTVSMVFATNECTTGSNSVNLAGIIAKKEAAGNCGGWSPGSLTFFVKDYGTRRDALTISTAGNLSTPYTMYAAAFRGNANVAGTGEAVYAPAGLYSTGTNWLYGTMYLNGNTVYDADSFQLNGRYSIWGRWNTYSGYITKIAYMTFDYNSNNGHEVYHSIASTDINGSYSDAVSLNSYNDITLRLDSNNNNANSYLRISNNSAGDGTIAWIGYESGMNQNYFSGSLGISAGPRTDGYRLNMGGSIHLNGNSVDYVGSLYFNGAGHIQPNAGSYGALQMTSSKNGWSGIRFTDSNVNLMVNSNESGFHNNSYGWQMRWENGTIYCHKNSYGGGTSATVWDSSNAPRAANSNLMYYQGFTLDANTMDSNATGFTYSVNAPTTGPIARFSTGGSYDLWLNAAYAGGGTVIYFRTRNGDAGTNNSWRRILNDGYDPYAANMNQYVRTSDSVTFSSVTATGQIYINNGDPTIFLQDSNHRSSMIHCNSNIFYILRGSGNNSTSWATFNGYWPLELSLETNDAVFGRNISAPVGTITAGNDMRAPIFYDSNDTTYYADFANSGTSIYTAGIIRSSGMIMKGSSGGGQIYPTISNGGVSLYGGNNLTNGAYFTVTGIDYASSPGAGSAEFVIRSTATSKFALFSYNGSTWTGRYALFGSTGNVTIGDANTDIGYRLYVIGDIYATGNVIAYSDARVKTNIREIENPLARVLNTRGVMYDRTDNEEKDNVGFIAQELEKEFPELISTSTDGRKGVKYQNMVAVLIEAMKEQNKEIQKLKMLINGASR